MPVRTAPIAISVPKMSSFDVTSEATPLKNWEYVYALFTLNPKGGLSSMGNTLSLVNEKRSLFHVAHLVQSSAVLPRHSTTLHPTCSEVWEGFDWCAVNEDVIMDASLWV